MELNEVVDAYLKSVGMVRVQGDSCEPIYPMIIMDSVLQLFTGHIVPLRNRHRLKQIENRWRLNYNTFNRDFYRSLSIEQIDFVNDIMDKFESYVEESLNSLEMVIFRTCSNVPDDKRSVVSWCLVCGILTKISQNIWRRIYKYPSTYLEVISKCSIDFTNEYCKGISVNPNDDENVSRKVEELCRKIMDFISYSKCKDS